MKDNPDSELKKIKNQRARFIANHFSSKIKDAKEYGILTNAHRCYMYSHKFTEKFVNYFYKRIEPKDPVILNDIESLRFDDNTSINFYNMKKVNLCYLSDPNKEVYGYSGGSLLEAPYELWERLKALIPILSETMEDWIRTKKKEKLKRMTQIPDNKSESSKPIIKYKITRIEISPEESEEKEE